MEIGKIPNDLLKKIILDKIKYKREEVIVRPKIGEDCCAVDFGEYTCVLSTDPITGAVNEIGRLAVHVSCNDIASCGVEPLGLLVTILAPPQTTEKDLETVMGQVCETAEQLNVDILGGHTEVTSSVNKCVITSTAIGRAKTERLVTTSGAKYGDDVVITKTAGIEGTAIIAHDKEEILSKEFGMEFVEKAKSFISDISVVREGIVAGEFGVTSMHDVTEGGILGAVWEIAEASKTGMEIYKDRIPVAEETEKICVFFGIDPLRLISSGCMMITCRGGHKLVKVLKDNGIEATVIGRVTQSQSKVLLWGENKEVILQPNADELYNLAY